MLEPQAVHQIANLVGAVRRWSRQKGALGQKRENTAMEEACHDGIRTRHQMCKLMWPSGKTLLIGPIITVAYADDAPPSFPSPFPDMIGKPVGEIMPIDHQPTLPLTFPAIEVRGKLEAGVQHQGRIDT